MLFRNSARVFTLSVLLAPALLHAASDAGENIYAQRCARCHELNNPRIPTRETLRKMPAARILRALNYGAMIAIAYTMNQGQREAVATWLGTRPGTRGGDPAPPASAFCGDRSVHMAAHPALAWKGWSPGLDNTRFQPTASSVK